MNPYAYFLPTTGLEKALAGYSRLITNGNAFLYQTGGSVLDQPANSAKSWVLTNLMPVALFMILVGAGFFLSGAFKKDWGRRALEFWWRPAVVLMIIVFLPLIFALVSSFVDAVGGDA